MDKQQNIKSMNLSDIKAREQLNNSVQRNKYVQDKNYTSEFDAFDNYIQRMNKHLMSKEINLH